MYNSRGVFEIYMLILQKNGHLSNLAFVKKYFHCVKFFLATNYYCLSFAQKCELFLSGMKTLK